jgi:hypothetical protein
MNSHLDYKPSEDDRFSGTIQHVKETFTADERRSLVEGLLGWDPSDSKYDNEDAIMEILSDLVLGKESSFNIMLHKGLEELPLYIINGAKNDKVIAQWRLRCGK